MKFLAKKTEVLTGSFKLSADGKTLTFQVNTEICVEGNPYADIPNTDPKRPALFTPNTIFDLSIVTVDGVIDMKEVATQAQTQAQAWVDKNYPSI